MLLFKIFLTNLVICALSGIFMKGSEEDYEHEKAHKTFQAIFAISFLAVPILLIIAIWMI